MSFQLPKLPYQYGALEPYFDAQTMEIHHTKHHQTYTDKLNQAVTGTEWESKSAEWLVSNLNQLPEKIRGAVRNHGGGFVNHNLFWQLLSPEFDQTPPPELLQKLENQFGSFTKFQEEFSNAAKTHFGSGWAWLVQKPSGELDIYSLPNQDSPLSMDDVPLLALDVWEHAYYLKYQNRRDEYIANFWHVINWQQVAKNLANSN
ncbi:MAG TPA: superoxide dismutase [Candidatus Woesebacteria bacterium]|nr:superoxide dismutase [Candidatus Woesebacteria bacterium]